MLDWATPIFQTIIRDLLSGQYGQPLLPGGVQRSRGMPPKRSPPSCLSVTRGAPEITETLRDFIASHLGRGFGVQLALPLLNLRRRKRLMFRNEDRFAGIESDRLPSLRSRPKEARPRFSSRGRFTGERASGVQVLRGRCEDRLMARTSLVNVNSQA
jgi:hypothetical protein